LIFEQKKVYAKPYATVLLSIVRLGLGLGL
jgi:hypothetical protein